jgi:hypothetical protein
MKTRLDINDAANLSLLFVVISALGIIVAKIGEAYGRNDAMAMFDTYIELHGLALACGLSVLAITIKRAIWK